MPGKMEMQFKKTGRDISRVAVRNDHPEAHKKYPKATADNMEDFITEADGMIENIITTRSAWEDRRVRNFKIRYGIRPKKNFPFPGASNLHLPIIDSTIRKVAPQYIFLAWGGGNLVQFNADPNGPMRPELNVIAKSNTLMMNHLMKYKMKDSFKKIMLLVDKMLDEGQTIVKVTYDYQIEMTEVKLRYEDMPSKIRAYLVNQARVLLKSTPEAEAIVSYVFTQMLVRKGITLDPSNKEDMAELKKAAADYRAGKKEFTFKVRQVINHSPFWEVCKLQDVIIHGGFNNIQDANMICHRMWVLPNDLKLLALSGKVDKDWVSDIMGLNKDDDSTPDSADPNQKQANKRNDYDHTVEKLTGSAHTEDMDDMIEVREVYLYASPTKDGILRRAKLLYTPALTTKAGSFHFLKYDDLKWPFVRFEREVKDMGILAPRGLTQMGDGIQSSIIVQHNQKINNQTIINAPMFKYIPGQVLWSNVRYIPGQGIPVKNMNAVEPFARHAPNQFSYVEEERELRAFWESYVASPDYSLSDPLSKSNDSRTATEVLRASNQSRQIAQGDNTLFLINLQELYEMTWSRHVQFGDERYQLAVTGQNEPTTWVKAYGASKMQIHPKASMDSGNPQFKLQQLERILGLASNPVFGPMLRTYNLVYEIVQGMFPEKHLDYLVPRNEWQKAVQQLQSQQQAAQQQAQEYQALIMRLESHLKRGEIKEKGTQDLTLKLLEVAVQGREQAQKALEGNSQVKDAKKKVSKETK